MNRSRALLHLGDVARPIMPAYFLGRPSALYVMRYGDPSARRRRRLKPAA